MLCILFLGFGLTISGMIIEHKRSFKWNGSNRMIILIADILGLWWTEFGNLKLLKTSFLKLKYEISHWIDDLVGQIVTDSTHFLSFYTFKYNVLISGYLIERTASKSESNTCVRGNNCYELETLSGKPFK